MASTRAATGVADPSWACADSVLGYEAQVASAPYGLRLRLIRAEPSRIAELAEALADVDGVAEGYSTAGDADIVAVVRVRQHDELTNVVTRGVNCLPGIVDTRTMIAFRSYSRHDVESMWSLGVE